MRTTIGVSKLTKQQLDELMRRKNLGSYHDAIKYLIQTEKELEMLKLSRPDDAKLKEIVKEAVFEAKAGY